MFSLQQTAQFLYLQILPGKRLGIFTIFSAELCFKLSARHAVHPGRTKPYGTSMQLGDNGTLSQLGPQAFYPLKTAWLLSGLKHKIRSSTAAFLTEPRQLVLEAHVQISRLEYSKGKFSLHWKASSIFVIPHRIRECQEQLPFQWHERLNSPSPFFLTRDSHSCWVIRKSLIENWVRLTTY